jgi:hypothetical protein
MAAPIERGEPNRLPAGKEYGEHASAPGTDVVRRVDNSPARQPTGIDLPIKRPVLGRSWSPEPVTAPEASKTVDRSFGRPIPDIVKNPAKESHHDDHVAEGPDGVGFVATWALGVVGKKPPGEGKVIVVDTSGGTGSRRIVDEAARVGIGAEAGPLHLRDVLKGVDSDRFADAVSRAVPGEDDSPRIQEYGILHSVHSKLTTKLARHPEPEEVHEAMHILMETPRDKTERSVFTDAEGNEREDVIDYIDEKLYGARRRNSLIDSGTFDRIAYTLERIINKPPNPDHTQNMGTPQTEAPQGQTDERPQLPTQIIVYQTPDHGVGDHRDMEELSEAATMHFLGRSGQAPVDGAAVLNGHTWSVEKLDRFLTLSENAGVPYTVIHMSPGRMSEGHIKFLGSRGAVSLQGSSSGQTAEIAAALSKKYGSRLASTSREFGTNDNHTDSKGGSKGHDVSGARSKWTGRFKSGDTNLSNSNSRTRDHSDATGSSNSRGTTHEWGAQAHLNEWDIPELPPGEVFYIVRKPDGVHAERVQLAESHPFPHIPIDRQIAAAIKGVPVARTKDYGSESPGEMPDSFIGGMRWAAKDEVRKANGPERREREIQELTSELISSGIQWSDLISPTGRPDIHAENLTPRQQDALARVVAASTDARLKGEINYDPKHEMPDPLYAVLEAVARHDGINAETIDAVIINDQKSRAPYEQHEKNLEQYEVLEAARRAQLLPPAERKALPRGEGAGEDVATS